MNRLFQVLQERVKEQKGTILATIIEATGSLPRTERAYMLVSESGRLYGTIGGGRMEYEAICTGKKLVEKKKNDCRKYHLNNEDSGKLGMVCGGSATVLFYYVDPGKDLEFIEQGLRYCNDCKTCTLELPLKEGNARIGEPIHTGNPDYYTEQLFADGKVYIFGGGHLAQEVVPVLSHLGFYCVVIDDREEFTKEELFPGAKRVLKTEFSNLKNTLHITDRDYFAIMTRGHMCDIEVEAFALKTPAKYIGAVGSAKKTAYVREQLKKQGFTDEDLDRVITPIGLDIKSETPAEIAISIAAQLILHRAKTKMEDIR